jgi:hypothetical protein
VLRTTARHHDGVRHQIAGALDQISAHRGQAFQRPPGLRTIQALRAASSKLREELRKRLFGRTEQHRVGMWGGFVRQRRHVKPAHRHERAPGPVVVGDAIRAIRVRDVDLNQDEIRLVIKIKLLHVLVHEDSVVVRAEERRQRGKAERREQRVLDGTPIGAGCLRERGQNELYFELTHTL